jgi:hypothetical protein
MLPDLNLLQISEDIQYLQVATNPLKVVFSLLQIVSAAVGSRVFLSAWFSVKLLALVSY